MQNEKSPNTLENEQMLETANTSIRNLDIEIAKLHGLRDVWMKIAGKIEGELYDRILPVQEMTADHVKKIYAEGQITGSYKIKR